MFNKRIIINTNIGCKNNCVYCPQKTIVSSYKKISDNTVMSLDVFKKILNNIPKDYNISFSSFNEPFQNPDTISMILCCVDNGYNVEINTTLVGLNKNIIDVLSNLSLVCFFIHLPNLDDYFMDKTDYLKLLSYTCKHVKNLGFVYFNSLDYDIKNLVESFGYKIKCGTLNSRCGILFKNQGYLFGPGFCEMKYDRVQSVLPDGSVNLCCMDFGLKHIFGNITRECLLSVYDKNVWKLFKKQQRMFDSDILCRNCEFFVQFFSLRYLYYVFKRILDNLGFI